MSQCHEYLYCRVFLTARFVPFWNGVSVAAAWFGNTQYYHVPCVAASCHHGSPQRPFFNIKKQMQIFFMMLLITEGRAKELEL